MNNDNNSDKVSVIIPTHNRFKYLLNAIDSIKNQTYKNIEIIVINDASTQKQYYDHNWNNIQIIHLNKSSKEIIGNPSPGYVRNIGIEKATGKYIAFCDDDDIWLPEKLEYQIKAMKETNCKMSSTEGYHGVGVYDHSKKYKLYNNEKHFNILRKKYITKSKYDLLKNGFPKIWNYDFLKIHNCMITSSVILDINIVKKIGKMSFKSYGEDYDYWLKCLKHTNSVYITIPCFYYDANHGNGNNH